MKITAKTKINMIIGDPVEHSLSPQMHNAGYEALGIDDSFVFVAAQIKQENLHEFISGAKVMGINGVTVTKPHKTKIMKYLDSSDDVSEKIGAINTVVNEEGKLIGYNTDWLGIVTPLEKKTSLQDKKVAVLGAGGAARAAVYGLTKKGANVTIFNRTAEHAKKLAEEFGCEFATFENLPAIKTFDIIFNATSVGFNESGSQTPLPREYITDRHIVFDAIYSPLETQLLKDAKAQGAHVIHGLEMLLSQGIAQFKLYTGHDAPEEAMRKVLMNIAK